MVVVEGRKTNCPSIILFCDECGWTRCRAHAWFVSDLGPLPSSSPRRGQRIAEQGLRAHVKNMGIVCLMWLSACDWESVLFWNPYGSISVHLDGARSIVFLLYYSRHSPQTYLGKHLLSYRGYWDNLWLTLELKVWCGARSSWWPVASYCKE